MEGDVFPPKHPACPRSPARVGGGRCPLARQLRRRVAPPGGAVGPARAAGAGRGDRRHRGTRGTAATARPLPAAAPPPPRPFCSELGSKPEGKGAAGARGAVSGSAPVLAGGGLGHSPPTLTPPGWTPPARVGKLDTHTHPDMRARVTPSPH